MRTTTEDKHCIFLLYPLKAFFLPFFLSFLPSFFLSSFPSFLSFLLPLPSILFFFSQYPALAVYEGLSLPADPYCKNE